MVVISQVGDSVALVRDSEEDVYYRIDSMTVVCGERIARSAKSSKSWDVNVIVKVERKIHDNVVVGEGA